MDKVGGKRGQHFLFPTREMGAKVLFFIYTVAGGDGVRRCQEEED
jgi:hypothetical protein